MGSRRNSTKGKKPRRTSGVTFTEALEDVIRERLARAKLEWARPKANRARRVRQGRLARRKA